MDNEGKIAPGRAAFLTYGSAAGNIVYTFTMVTDVTGRPFWIAVLIGVLLNIPFAVGILFLSSYKKGGTLFDLLEDGLGKLICKCVILIYFLLNIAISVCMLNMFAGTVKVFFLPRTPAFVIILFIVLICAVFANSGIQYFGRLIALLCVLATANYFIGFSLSFVKEFKIEYITPIFDASYAQFAKGVMLTAGTNAECLLFLMVMVSSTPQTSKHYLSIIKGLLTWSIVLSSAILIMEGNVGQELLSRVAEAGITVASILEIGTFVRGLEIFILMTYQYIVIMKTTIFLYSCWTSAKKLFNVQKGRPLLYISALVIFGTSAWVNSYNTGYFFAVFLGNYVILPFVAIVLLLSTISILIKKTKAVDV
jgi:spore germination protein KB